MQQIDSNDTRKNLEKLIQDSGVDMSFLSSEVLKKNHSYLYGFLKRHSPQSLSENSRFRLAAFFKVSPKLFFSEDELKTLQGLQSDTAAADQLDEFLDKRLEALTRVASDAVATMRRAQNLLQGSNAGQDASVRQHYLITITHNAKLLSDISKKIEKETANIAYDTDKESPENDYATRIIKKFGGVTKLSKLLKHKHASTVSEWARKKVIPARQQAKLLKIAPLHGVQLSPADFFNAEKPEA